MHDGAKLLHLVNQGFKSLHQSPNIEYFEPATLILEFSPKTDRFRRSVFGLQSQDCAPDGRAILALNEMMKEG